MYRPIPSYRLRQVYRLGRSLIAASFSFLALLLISGLACAHGGPLDIVNARTTLAATFSVGSPPGSLASSNPLSAYAGNIEVNYPPGFVELGLPPGVDGVGITMADVSFSDPSIGSFNLTEWRLHLATPVPAPLASDGSFALADTELRIDRGELTGTLAGIGPIHRSFASDPLTLIQIGNLRGVAIGDTNTNSGAGVGLVIPFDQVGSLAASGGVSFDAAIKGQFVAGSYLAPIPEPSVASLFAGGLAILVFLRHKRGLPHPVARVAPAGLADPRG